VPGGKQVPKQTVSERTGKFSDVYARMKSDEIQRRVAQLFAAIEICRDKKLILPALILVYSTIDIMAWLNRDEQHEDVKRSDFLLWVETFLLPNTDLACTSLDLYGARCSLLHSYSAASRLSRKGEASQLFYAWGDADEEELQKLIDRDNTRDAKAVHVEKLISALKVAVQRFLATMSHTELIQLRVEKFFTDMPPLKLDDLLG